MWLDQQKTLFDILQTNAVLRVLRDSTLSWSISVKMMLLTASVLPDGCVQSKNFEILLFSCLKGLVRCSFTKFFQWFWYLVIQTGIDTYIYFHDKPSLAHQLNLRSCESKGSLVTQLGISVNIYKKLYSLYRILNLFI